MHFRKYTNLAIHLLAWLILGFSLFFYQPLGWPISLPLLFWIKQTFLLSLLIALYYLNTLVLIPNLMFKNRQLWYLVVVIAVCSLQIFFGGVVDRSTGLDEKHLDVQIHLHDNKHTDEHGNRLSHFDNTFALLDCLLVGIGIILSFNRKWQHEIAIRQALEQEKAQSELLYLKAQINPHFFFNTLNTIYAYTLTDGEIARTAITNLSKMMRYVLYESHHDQVTLSKEISFIRDYIDLMKLRLSGKMTVITDIPADFNDTTIPPMLFLPFIENAFKHGTSTIEDGRIQVIFLQHEEYLELSVINSFFPERQNGLEEGNGIGLANTRRRMDLLYPGKYALEAGINTKSEYEIRLLLKII